MRTNCVTCRIGWSIAILRISRLPRSKLYATQWGPDIGIMLDLSGGLTTDETIRLCRRFEELNILWIEEPADPFDVGALKKISDAVHIPIAVGERIYTRHGFRKIFEPHAADIVQPDAGNTGGIMETKKIAAMVEVSLPKTRFEHSDGVVRQGPDTGQCRRTVRRAVCRAHPSQAKRGSEPHCNRSCISRGFAEGARR